MKELSGRGEKFYKKWEERRKKKWLFVFLNGFVYWGLFMAVSMFIWKSDFKIEKMHLSDLVSAIIFFGIAGIPLGLSRYIQIDKIYLSLLNDDVDILDGIKTLKAGKTWKYENLIIKNVNNDTLVVRNNLFWFDESDDLNEKLNECFDTVVADYKGIKKEPKFEEFSRNYKVRIQIFEVLDNEKPMIDKAI